MSDTPIYDALVGELLIDPVAAAREFDEELILWHAGQQRPTGATAHAVPPRDAHGRFTGGRHAEITA